ncbi:MAG TPA: type II toxin-antitoxin system RelE/ParE family toxin [Stellaceae bacterium]|nr:type II toxin-antitoxin system RelE/ParE family toxin [Stellaceae bacterium]
MQGRKRPAIWSPEARVDLSEIWAYYRRTAGRQAADKIVREITAAVRLLPEAHPLGGRPREELRPGLRSIAARPRVIFYRVRRAVPEIVRVLDGRRDLDEIFSDDADA